MYGTENRSAYNLEMFATLKHSITHSEIIHVYVGTLVVEQEIVLCIASYQFKVVYKVKAAIRMLSATIPVQIVECTDT